MVDISGRVKEIRKLVDDGKYFTINRARQYGKTTTLTALRQVLMNDYTVLNLSFEGISRANFDSEQSFVKAFCRLFKKNPDLYRSIPDDIRGQMNDYMQRKEEKAEMDELFLTLGEWCAVSVKPIVLLIDEVDSAANNQVFLDFLAQLRDGYIRRESEEASTFKSVILAGVTDVKHLKMKLRDDADAKENSPWNIATDFMIDMSLSEAGICGMLEEYEADHHTGMNVGDIAGLLRAYTEGYPFLVSRICQLLDERIVTKIGLEEAWTRSGFDEAVKMLLAEDNTLFQTLTKNLNNYPALKNSIRSILMDGTRLTWNSQQKEIVHMQMYGLIRNDHNSVRIANRIFETLLYNLFLSDEELKQNVFSKEGELAKNHFVEDGKLNLRKVLDHFIQTYNQVCGPLKDRFMEKDGRELFLLYLKPIINETGNYYIEAQTRDQTRTDVIVDYLGQQYIIELKIWRGERYNTEGEKQVSEYLDYFGLSTGYMLSFNYNKKKEQGVKQVEIGDKVLFEGTL